MTYRDQLTPILRAWDDGLLWRFEWNRDEDTWCDLPFPPWRAEA